MSRLLDQYGNPMQSAEVQNLRGQIMQLVNRNQKLQARYDSAQTTTENELHWANADRFDPNTTASLDVRQKIRSRSRYEVLENNPYLKGTILTICNDFTGTGPRLKITDERIPKDLKRKIERNLHIQFQKIKMRQKLWRMRLAKLVDGESFGWMRINPRLEIPVPLDVKIYETDQITSPGIYPQEGANYNEVDGVRFIDEDNILEYHVLRYHPGGSFFNRLFALKETGQWVKAKYMIHWFRKDRGWVRGIPETAASLPLCSILRRYTLAILRHAEVQADLTAVIETQGPPNANVWTQNATDDPFDTFPIDRGLIMNLPWGYSLKQLEATPHGAELDEFIGAILREIMRPLLVPYNMSIGSSKDANMSSGVVDTHIYKEGQNFERLHCNEEVLDPYLAMWWRMGVLTDGYFSDALRNNKELRYEPPIHEWRWDRIGLDHTDPQKVAQAITMYKEARILTDADIQEQYYNRDVEAWREEVMEDEKWKETLPSVKAEREAAKKAAEAPKPGQPNSKKPAPKKPAPKKAKSTRARRPAVTRR